MDHLDWFSPGSIEAQEEIDQFKRVLAPGGMVFWRSASRNPWYNEMRVFIILFIGLSDSLIGPGSDRQALKSRL